jgi:hypothetical protein
LRLLALAEVHEHRLILPRPLSLRLRIWPKARCTTARRRSATPLWLGWGCLSVLLVSELRCHHARLQGRSQTKADQGSKAEARKKKQENLVWKAEVCLWKVPRA